MPWDPRVLHSGPVPITGDPHRLRAGWSDPRFLHRLWGRAGDGHPRGSWRRARLDDAGSEKRRSHNRSAVDESLAHDLPVRTSEATALADELTIAPDGDTMSEAELREEIDRLPAALRAQLDAAGFDEEKLLSVAARLAERSRKGASVAPDVNRVRGKVDPPRTEDVGEVPAAGTAEYRGIAEAGLAALKRGELAFCVMAGGMATRMGGVVKALVNAFDSRTFLDLRLAENAMWCTRAGNVLPLWLMTSEATDGPIRKALSDRSAPSHVRVFRQNLSLRLTREGRLFFEADGGPSPYAPGHGDLPDALRRSGLLADFVARGGKYVWIANLDNLGATVDPAILGYFLGCGRDVMAEVTEKVQGDRGGIPVWADVEMDAGRTERRLQILEEFRLPIGFDAQAVRVFNCNTFLIQADTLLRAPLRWTFFEVEKKVEGRVAVQFERLIQELTAFVPTAYLRVPREGALSRFLPVKDNEELARRADEIRAVVRTRMTP
jgi:UTP--glucose-1-phosphate uridylyltransferase